jgi:hypothetical protein
MGSNVYEQPYIFSLNVCKVTNIVLKLYIWRGSEDLRTAKPEHQTSVHVSFTTWVYTSNPAKYLHLTHYITIITKRVSVTRTLINVLLYLKLAKRMNTPKLRLGVTAQKIQTFTFLQKLTSWVFFFF